MVQDEFSGSVDSCPQARARRPTGGESREREPRPAITTRASLPTREFDSEFDSARLRPP